MPSDAASPLQFSRALNLVLTHAAALPAPAQEQVPLSVALHRTLASAILADRDLPPFRRSTRDGYAVTAAAIASGTGIKILGTVRAGSAWQKAPLNPGEAVAIMTGAPVPKGADAVIMVEHADRSGDWLTLSTGRSLAAGENIVPTGAEAHAGSTLLPAGTRLTPAEIALAATCGITRPTVYCRPRVAILSTGDELVPPDATPGPSQIRNSNSSALAALVAESAAQPVTEHILPDSAVVIEAALHAACADDTDLLLLSGGVSVGEYDFVETALAQLHAEFYFTAVNMQPGRPVVFGSIPASELRGRPLYFFALPGNPVSVQVCCLLFVVPFLAALSGAAPAPPRFVLATLAEDLRVRPGPEKFLPAALTADYDVTTVRLVRWQGSGDLSANARANAYLTLPPECDFLPAGTLVRVLLR